MEIYYADLIAAPASMQSAWSTLVEIDGQQQSYEITARDRDDAERQAQELLARMRVASPRAGSIKLVPGTLLYAVYPLWDVCFTVDGEQVFRSLHARSQAEAEEVAAALVEWRKAISPEKEVLCVSLEPLGEPVIDQEQAGPRPPGGEITL